MQVCDERAEKTTHNALHVTASRNSMNTVPTDAALQPGQKLSGVYVLRKLITLPGSESPIWLAHDEVLGKDVSLHFIPTAVRADSRAMTDLRQEVKRNRQLIHPNILRVYDLIEEPEWAAISMDAFEGESLAAMLRQKEGGFFEPSDVKPWIQQLCPTLDDVHKIQLVHRNISPLNIFIDKEGKLLIANFGISRVMDDAIGRVHKAGEGVERHLAYMSPQQLDGETPSSKDDIYSLGASVYELLAGSPPFHAGELVPQIRKAAPESIMDRRGKTEKRGGTVLPVWEKAIAACLAKTPEERPRSASEFASSLGVGARPGEAATVMNAPAPKSEKAKSDKATIGEKSTPWNLASDRKVPDSGKAGKTEPVSAKRSTDKKEKTYDDIAAAVAEDERRSESGGGEEENYLLGGGISRDFAPTKSRKPMVAGVLTTLAVLGGAWYFFAQGDSSKQKGDQAGDDRVPAQSDIAQVKNSDPAPDSSAAPASHDPALPPVTTPAEKLGGDGLQKADDATPETKPAVAANPPKSATPPAATNPAIAVTGSTKLPAVTKDPAPIAAAPEQPTTLLAANQHKDKDKGGTPTPAAAALGNPIPRNPTSANADATGGGGSLDKIRQAAQAAEKKALDAHKQQQQAEAAAAETKKSIDEKAKASGPALEATKALQSQRQQREDQVKAADLAAQQARQAAEEKTKAADEAKKALADWNAQNAPKLAARTKAEAEFQALQTALADKQRAASDAASAAAEADNASKLQAAALAKAQDAEQTRLAKEAKKAQLAERLQGIDELQKKLDAQMRELQKLKMEIEQPSAPSSAAPQPQPAPAAPAGSQNVQSSAERIAAATPPPATPVAIAIKPDNPKASPPPAPPPPKPIVNAEASSHPLVTDAPAIPAPVISEPAPPASSHLEPSPVAEASDATGASGKAGFESSLGMKFAPVGDVLFCIWPTRVKDFEVFAKETNLRSSGWRTPGFKQGPEHPVVEVTWNDAMSFCKWLTERDRKKGLLTASQMYRLPTDVEWSRAVGLPEETGRTPEARDMGVPDIYPWGTQWPPPPNVGNYTGEETGSDVAIKGYDDGFAWTSPVGSFPANRYGLYDMGGNVWQWCMDNWNNESKAKVLRGASWYNGGLKLSLLSSCRVNENPESSTDNYGFRIVRANEGGKTKGK